MKGKTVYESPSAYVWAKKESGKRGSDSTTGQSLGENRRRGSGNEHFRRRRSTTALQERGQSG